MAGLPKNIVILTGAGISAESGIDTFRDEGGIWDNHRIEDVCTPEAFKRNPELVQDFYNMRRATLQTPEIKPNAAHLAITELQKEHSGTVTVITQNIDNLHERAGSTDVIHMHGELLKARCSKTGRSYDWTENIEKDDICPCCHTKNTLRPHIVWFGEMPLMMDEIYKAIENVDLFVAIGTSGSVYPAASFVTEANARDADTLEINLQPGLNQSLFKRAMYGLASKKVPEWVESLLVNSVSRRYPGLTKKKFD
ncbi:Sir2 family NAD+-dependent deacetylase [Entomomonas asaccharolytica]|uniref:NAD-dependent protein deacylase n=1 Tax=Entomomonas asaccharolytica TaxID=2785331 RepID=A0A974RXX7_9GAMM|nr:Sir2 family NAD+-dependent deacetylase [Entomomonas asaccharolytica]QQP86703.1 NAD-dependent protein deacylase [Entomomonas asaccharolytica]